MREKNVIKMVCWMWIVFFSSYTYAANSYEYTCPELMVTQTASHVDPSWEVTSDKSVGQYLLSRAGILSGRSTLDRGELLPDSSDRVTDREYKSVWTFVKDPDYKLWITCVYRNTKLIITRQLPNDITMCKVVQQLLPTGSKITGTTVSGTEKITCQ